MVPTDFLRGAGLDASKRYRDDDERAGGETTGRPGDVVSER